MKICRVTVERTRVLHQGPYVSAIGTVNLFIGDEEVGGGVRKPVVIGVCVHALWSSVQQTDMNLWG